MFVVLSRTSSVATEVGTNGAPPPSSEEAARVGGGDEWGSTWSTGLTKDHFDGSSPSVSRLAPSQSAPVSRGRVAVRAMDEWDETTRGARNCSAKISMRRRTWIHGTTGCERPVRC
jgi:hypothetical protein